MSVPRRLPLDLTQPCWPWPASKSDQGYGIFMLDSERKYAHRVAYQLHVGAVPRGWELDHVCHTAAAARGECTEAICAHRACWNPAHLEAVSSRENSLRGNHPLFAVARNKTCRRGHDLSIETNVVVRPNGKRRCRPCAADYQRDYRGRAKPSAA